MLKVNRNLLIVLVLSLVALRIAPGYAESAKRLYARGEAAEGRDDLENAYQAYLAALGKSPGDIRFKVAVDRIRTEVASRHVHRGETLAKEKHIKEALVEFFQALDLDPGNSIAGQNIEKIKEEMDKKDKPTSADDPPNAYDLDRPGPPIHLDSLSEELITLHMTQQSTVLYQTIGKAAGINVLIDPDFVPKSVTLDCNRGASNSR